MYRSPIETMLENKKNITVGLATGHLEIPKKKVIKLTKLRKNGISKFLNNMNLVKPVWIGSDGKKYNCKYGENADGSCVNGVIVAV